MAQIFHPSTNTVSRVSIFGGLFVVAGLLWLMGAVNRSPYVTGQDVVIDQPVPFSHAHHVAGLGIDCRHCHTTVEVAASAGMPSTKVCMTCHSQIWLDSPLLEPVRASFRDDASIPWVRVHDLPDFAYFDHSIHLAKGIGCASCHGRVDRMPLMWRENTLNMEWCIDCHRAPQLHVRPREELFRMDWTPEESGLTEADLDRLAEQYHVKGRTSCSACHR
jgi:Zn ribbon nucleic-acid-binding protein